MKCEALALALVPFVRGVFVGRQVKGTPVAAARFAATRRDLMDFTLPLR
jgi:hypothetical protein